MRPHDWVFERAGKPPRPHDGRGERVGKPLSPGMLERLPRRGGSCGAAAPSSSTNVGETSATRPVQASAMSASDPQTQHGLSHPLLMGCISARALFTRSLWQRAFTGLRLCSRVFCAHGGVVLEGVLCSRVLCSRVFCAHGGVVLEGVLCSRLLVAHGCCAHGQWAVAEHAPEKCARIESVATASSWYRAATRLMAVCVK
jgi:hypothetical protein